MTWGGFIYRLYEIGDLHRNMLLLYWIGWGDYNDPSNFLNPLFTNRSIASNGAQYNGYAAAIEAGRDPPALWDNVQLLMEAGLSETDPIAREAIYDRIQEAYDGTYDSALDTLADQRRTFFTPQEILALAKEAQEKQRVAVRR